jgi:hypothetical protein
MCTVHKTHCVVVRDHTSIDLTRGMHLRQWISNFHACQLRDDSSSAASTLRSQPLFRSAVDTYLGDDEKKPWLQISSKWRSLLLLLAWVNMVSLNNSQNISDGPPKTRTVKAVKGMAASSAMRRSSDPHSTGIIFYPIIAACVTLYLIYRCVGQIPTLIDTVRYYQHLWLATISYYIQLISYITIHLFGVVTLW